MAYPAGFETRSDSAVGGTINDVTTGTGASTDLITASNHNILQSAIYELEKKLGLSLVDPSAPTIGHFKMTTQAGTPSGTPVNGVGSMVWNNSANSLHVNTTGSTWAEIGGGGGATAFDGSAPAATNKATIAATENSDPLLIITQSGSAGILQGIGVDTDQGFLFDNTGKFQLSFSTYGPYNPTFDFGGTDTNPYMQLYGQASTNSRALRYEIKVGKDAHSYTRLTGRNKNGASLFLGDDDGPAASYEYELGIRYVSPSGDTDLFLKGADEIWRTEHAAGGSFNLYRKLTMFTTAGLTAGTVAIHTDSGTATGGGLTTLIDTGGGWTDDEWINGGLKITRNTDSSVHYVVITDNTATTLTFATPGFTIVSSDTYSIQAGGLTLTSNVNEVSTVAAATHLCVMPPAFAGERVTVINNGANSMRLYPFLDDDLGAGVNTLTNLAADANITYIAYNSVNWVAVT